MKLSYVSAVPGRIYNSAHNSLMRFTHHVGKLSGVIKISNTPKTAVNSRLPPSL